MIQKFLSPKKARSVLKWYYILTAIGTITHEYAHKSFAESAGLEIIEVEYFTLSGGHLGKVKHGPPKTYSDLFAISVAPFLVNTSIAFTLNTITIGYATQKGISNFFWYEWVGFGIIFYITISLTLQAFPSMTDISNIKNAAGYIWKERKPRVTSWIENKLNTPSITPFTIKHIASEMKNITIAIILSPLWVIFTLTHMIIFTLFHTKVIITAPFVAILQVLDATRKYGSQFIFTSVIIFISYEIATKYTPILFEVVKETLS